MPSTAFTAGPTVVVVAAAPSSPAIPGTGTSSGAPAQTLYADGVIIRGALWRFIVTDLSTQTLTILDKLATSKTVLAQRGAPLEITAVVPSDNPQVNILHTDDYPFVHEGNRLLYAFRREGGGSPVWKIRGSTVILGVSDTGEQDPASSEIHGYDPWQYLYDRPALHPATGTPTGVYPGPTGINFTADNGALIALQVLYNSITDSDLNGIAFIDLPADYGGTGYWTGTIEDTGPIGDENYQWNVEQGKSVADVWNDLVATGTMDIVLEPIYEPLERPGVCCQLSILRAQGVQRPGAVLGWDKPGRSLGGLNRLLDGGQRANILKLYAGQGGKIAGDISPTSGTAEQQALSAASVALFHEYVLQQFFPDKPRSAMVNALANQILRLRSLGVETFTASPVPERSASPLLEYAPGDQIPVYASDNLRQATAGYKRVESIPIEIDDDGVEQVRAMLLSNDLPEEE